MAVYAIISEFPQPELKESISQNFEGAYFHFTDTVSFVRSTGTSKAIARSVGVKDVDDDGHSTGRFENVAVVRANPSYWGFSKASLWDWLKDAFEADD